MIVPLPIHQSHCLKPAQQQRRSANLLGVSKCRAQLWGPGGLGGLQNERRRKRYALVLQAASDSSAASNNNGGGSGRTSSSSAGSRHREAEMDAEIASIALPMLITLAADPLAGLVETAFIGRLGAVELAGMAVGLSIFATVTKFLNIPLISSTTTAVARATGARPKQQQQQQQQQSPAGAGGRPQGQVEPSQHKAGGTLRGHSQQQVISKPSSSTSTTASNSPAASSSVAPSVSPGAGGAESDAASGSSSAGVADARVETGGANRSNRGSEGTSTSAEGVAGSPFDPDASIALPPGRHSIRSSMDVSGQQQDSREEEEGGGGVRGGEAAVGTPQSPVSTAASSAILLGAVIGVLEVLFVCFGASGALRLWGVTSGASGDMYRPALDFLQVRALGAPVQVLMLTLQGVFRGLQDARTPLQCSLASNFLNVLLAPVLIFWAGWGVKGAAAAIVIAQALPTLYLLHALSKRVQLQLTSKETLIHLTKLAGPSGWLMIRSLGSTWTYAFATATVARAGAMHAAAHQVCFQLWMATTLTADAVAVAVQSLLAKSIAQGNVPESRRLVERCLTVGVAMGLVMALAVGTFRHALARIFTTDPYVLSLIASVMPMLVITQPINALAFVADGALFGVGGFKFASASMALAALPSLALIAYGSSQVDHLSLVYVWLGLGLLMSVRAVSILAAYLVKRGPFRELSLPSDLGDRGNGKRGWVLTWGKHRLKLL